MSRHAVTGRGGPAGSGSRCAELDRGSATVWVLAVGLVLVLAGLGAAVAGSVLVGRGQARTAADLAALAGAVEAARGAGAACGRAGEFATANGAVLTACAVAGLEVTVSVAVPVAVPRRAAGATARAGPLGAPIDG